MPKLHQQNAVWTLLTMVMGIRFSDGNANGVTVNNFLSRLWILVNNQSGLEWQITTCCQQSNVQVRGVKNGFGVFITQSFERRNPILFTKVIAYGCWVGNQNAFGRSSILSQPSDAGTASDVVCTRIRGKRPSELG